MKRRGRFPIPAASILIAFESAARHGSFSRAADELRTSQPAISRQIAKLEQQLHARLFERSRSGVSLTDAGTRFRDAVVAGLGIIHWAAADVTDRMDERQVAIMCSNCASHFLLLPLFGELQEALGEEVRIRILPCDRDPQDLPPNPIADLILTWKKPRAAPGSLVPIFRESVGPLCSPAYLAAHEHVLNGPVADWNRLTILGVRNARDGCATWEDWFQAVGYPATPPRTMSFHHYAYVLEAAAAGRGIGLGWRGLMDERIQSGNVIQLTDKYIDLDSFFYGLLTRKGRSTPLARKCLRFLERWAESWN